MKLFILFGLITNVLSNIIFSFSAQPFSNQCVNNKLSIFGLNMFIKGNINGIPFNLPMAELGLPVINMNWFVNGIPANQLMVMQNFNVDNSMTSGNVWSFQLQDDQPNIGAGIITLGTCNQGITYSITASFSTTSFIVGVGFPSLNLPAASGIPIIINNLASQNINNGGGNTIITTISPITTSSLRTTILPSSSLPVTTSFVSKIIFTISSQPFNKQCVNNKLNIFGLNMFVKGSVNGIPFNLPMAEIGLPVINMNWFVNGIPANQLMVMQNFNVNNSMTSGNIWTFQLKNDQSNIGAGTITLGTCNQGIIYSITVSFSTTSFISGIGIPTLGIPPVSGIPVIINNLIP